MGDAIFVNLFHAMFISGKATSSFHSGSSASMEWLSPSPFQRGSSDDGAYCALLTEFFSHKVNRQIQGLILSSQFISEFTMRIMLLIGGPLSYLYHSCRRIM